MRECGGVVACEWWGWCARGVALVRERGGAGAQWRRRRCASVGTVQE